MSNEDLKKDRNSILSEKFTIEQRSGARWNTPGWTEANAQLDKDGVEPKRLWTPEIKPPA